MDQVRAPPAADEAASSAGAASARARTFISYSRKDMSFADRLEASLRARGFEPLIDRSEIYAFEDWWARIESLIRRADTVIFVLSPDAVASEVALKEVAHAASLNKRFAPIICRQVDVQQVPEPLRRLNFIAFDDAAGFEHSFERLAEALQTDIGWVRKHTEFGEAAHRWTAGGRPKGLLLRSPILEEAEQWIASRPHSAPSPTSETQSFVAQSRRGVTQRRNLLTGSLATGLLVALGLAAIAYWQRSVALEQRGVAERNEIQAKEQRDRALLTQSQFLADASEQLLRRGDAIGAALVAIEALPDAHGGIARPYLADAELAMANARDGIKEASILVGHTSEVYSAAFSPDGRLVATSSDDRSARIWDAATGKTLWVLSAHAKPVYSVAFSPDGGSLVTGGGDAAIRFWDPHAGQLRGKIGFKNPDVEVLNVAFSRDGQRLLVSLSPAEVLLLDLSTGKVVTRFRGHRGRFSPDGQRVVTTLGKTALISDSNTGQVVTTLEGHDSPVLRAAFSPDGRRVATASADAAYIWDLTTGGKVASLEGQAQAVNTLVFSADARRVLTVSTDGATRIWDARTGKLDVILAGPRMSGVPDYASQKHPLTRFTVLSLIGGTHGAAFSPDGKRVVIASWDKTARIFNLDHEKPVDVAVIEGPAHTASFSPDGERVAIASADGNVKIWSVSQSALLATLTVQAFRAAFSPDGQRLLTVGHDKTARIWDLRTNTTVTSIADAATNWSGSFSPDAARILTVGDDAVRIWDAATGALIMSLDDPPPGMMNARFSRDGERIVTAGHGNSAIIWDSGTGRRIRVLEHTQRAMSAAFSPDGRYVLTASRDGYAHIWDASSGNELKSFPSGGILLSAAFSPNGRRIATGPAGGIWDVETGHLIKDLHCDCALFDIEFGPDGGSVLAAVSDQTRIWPVPSTQELIDRLKQLTHRCLTAGERRAVFLDPDPPAWCIDMEKWPYNTQDWQEWLRFKRANLNPPLADTPEWRSWRAPNG